MLRWTAPSVAVNVPPPRGTVNVVSTVGKPFGGAGVVGSVVQVVASVVDEVVVELVVVVLETDRTELVFDEWLSVEMVVVVEHSMQLNVVVD
jgi:hypothetical protein